MRNIVYEPPSANTSKPKLMIKELHKSSNSCVGAYSGNEQNTCADILQFLKLRNDWVTAQCILKRVQCLQMEISNEGATESQIKSLIEETSELKLKIENHESAKLDLRNKLENELLTLTTSYAEKKQSVTDQDLYLERCETEEREESKYIDSLRKAINVSIENSSQREEELGDLEKVLSSEMCILDSINREVDDLNEKLNSHQAPTDSPLEYRPRVMSARERQASLSALIKQQRERNRCLRYEIMTRRKNIRVFCRIRRSFEPNVPDAVIPVLHSDTEIRVSKPLKTYKGVENKDEYFTLDKVFGPQHTNEEVFFEIEPLIQGALKGHNICVFAYGQTSAGKSHTMISEDGIINRSVTFIFDELHSMDDTDFDITGSCVEVYLDHVNDLFSGLGTSNPSSRLGTALEFENRNDVLQALSYAQTRRKTTSTIANASSSRSHFIFSIGVNTYNRKTKSKINCVLRFIDLAGSERVFSDDPARLQETKAINSSLSTLATVIQALHNPGSHVPFRASKLTELLAPSLTDNSKVLMLVNVAPEKNHVNETLSSLRFAIRANSAVLN